MTVRRWKQSRFDAQEEEPLGPLANLVDVMLVFACGLIAALLALSGDIREKLMKDSPEISKGREMSELPEGFGQDGNGYESVGKVYRDPKTGKLILIGEQDTKK